MRRTPGVPLKESKGDFCLCGKDTGSMARLRQSPTAETGQSSTPVANPTTFCRLRKWLRWPRPAAAAASVSFLLLFHVTCGARILPRSPRGVAIVESIRSAKKSSSNQTKTPAESDCSALNIYH